MSSPSKKPDEVKLLPFQQEQVATNQQNVPCPYFAGTRLLALRWIMGATDEYDTQVQGGGKKG